jgi:uncharacterized membrane-anchored protein YhcB (DUF1043 family)
MQINLDKAKNLLDNTKNQLDKAFTQAKKIQKIVKIR